MPRSEMLLAFNELMEERQLPPELIVEALKQAIASAYRKTTGAPSSQKVDVIFDLPKGQIRILAEKEVVAEVNDPHLEISLAEAREINPQAQIGDFIMVDVTPRDFGRIAAQTARQVLKQRLSELERKMQYDHFSQLVGEIVAGVVQAVHPQEIVVGLEKRAEGHLPRKEQIPGERFHVHDRIRALLLEVKETSKGPYIILSRAHPNFLRRLLEEEVPEIYRGEVEIRAIAREPGRRSKVAVSAIAPNIDPVGACVGIRGVRIQAIMRELNGEKIDVILWDPNPAVFITKALSPARVLRVYLRPNPEGGIPRGTAIVVVHENELSQAIGKEGQNVRLAAKLTRWRIDIKSLPEAATEALEKVLERREAYDWLDDVFLEQVQHILEKKQMGRPLTPEEYDLLLRFLDLVEEGHRKEEEERRRRAEEERALREEIPAVAFEQTLEHLNLPPRLVVLLTNAGYATVGDLLLQWKRNPDAILALNGIGPRAMETIREALEAYEAQYTVEEAEPQAEEAPPEALPEPTEAISEAEAVVQALEAQVEAIEVAAEPAGVEAAEEAPVSEAPTEVPEAVAEAVAEEAEAAVPEPAPAEEEAAVEAETMDMEDIFAAERVLSELPLEAVAEEEEPEMPPETPKKKKKKAKKKKAKKPKPFVELEEVEGEDLYVARRRRKRDEDEWEEW